MNTTTARGLPRKTSRTADLAGARGFHPEVFAQANQQAQPTSTARGFHPHAMAQAQPTSTARGFNPHAMAQAQALNQQPDSIPAMMKPGEYVLPPDTVQALGGPQVLDATVAQTHTPANAGAIVPRGFKPRLFFDDGGLVQDEEQKPKPISPTNTYPQGSPGAGANASTAARGFPGPGADPGARINEQIANAQQQRQQGIAAAQRTQAYDSVTQQQRQQAYDTWQSNKPWFMPTPQHDTRLQAAEKSYTDTLAGRSASTTPAPAAPAPAQTSQAASSAGAAPERTPEQIAKLVGGLDRHHAQNVQLQAAARTPEQARAAVQQAQGPTEVVGAPGVYRHAPGQYSDNPQGMGFTPGFTGQPSAQNLQAANVLASQQQAQSTARVQAAQQAAPQARGFPGFQMPRQENAYEREARMRERNRIMGMLQTPLTGDPRRDLTASQRQQLVAQLGQESQERQSTERNMFGLAGQQLNAETQRYSTDASAAVGMARNAIDQQRLGLAAQQQQEQSLARGFDIRAAQRREGILQQFDAAKTDEERAQLRQRYPDVFGQNSENLRNNFMVVGGGQELDPTTQTMRNVPQRLIDLRTLQEVGAVANTAPPPPAPKDASKRVVGQKYTGPNGQVAIWNGRDWDLPK